MPTFGTFSAYRHQFLGSFFNQNSGTNTGVTYEHYEGPTSPTHLDNQEYDDEIERPPLRHIDQYIKPEIPCLSKRVSVALMACIGFIIMFGMRCTMGMAKLQLEHGVVSNFNWTVATMSAVDSSIFWGYLVTQIPGGLIAAKYAANSVFGLAIGSSSFLFLFVPTAYMLHPSVLITIRVMQGLVEGVAYPACHGIWRYWAPPLERSRLATLAFCGTYAGIFFGLPLSGFLISTISWQSTFYFYGICGMLWYIAWLWLVFEKPCKHPTISMSELRYIESSLGEVDQSIPTIANTPWKAFSTSMPVYAIIVANFCRSWNFYLLVLYQAAFFEGRFHLKMEENGMMGSLPHLIMTIIVPTAGILADHLRKNNVLSTTNVRKVLNCGGFGMEAFFFIILAYSKTPAKALMALTCGVAFSGLAISGYNVNHLDIAPRYASILMGISNGLGTVAGVIVPIAVDYITADKASESWTTVFLLGATIHFIGVIFYGIFASGELQIWAEPIIESRRSQQWNPFQESIPMRRKTLEAPQVTDESQSGDDVNSLYANPFNAQRVSDDETQETTLFDRRTVNFNENDSQSDEQNYELSNNVHRRANPFLH